MRSFGAAPLFLGTVIIGASMCLLGVLTPVIVKRDFPRHVGLMMGLYTMLICLGPAVATATAVPMQHALGDSWERVLLFWGLPALVGAIVFLPQLLRKATTSGMAEDHVTSVLRDPLAWQVTGYFGLISSLAYAVFSWGPSMLQARGLDPTASGVVVSISYIAQMVTGLLAPVIAGRQHDQRLIIVIAVAMTAAGLLGFIFAPVWSLSFVFGRIGTGSRSRLWGRTFAVRVACGRSARGSQTFGAGTNHRLRGRRRDWTVCRRPYLRVGWIVAGSRGFLHRGRLGISDFWPWGRAGSDPQCPMIAGREG